MQGGVSGAERNARKDAAPKAAGGETPAEAGGNPAGGGKLPAAAEFLDKIRGIPGKFALQYGNQVIIIGD